MTKAATAGGYHIITEAPPAHKKGSAAFGSHLFVDWLFGASKGDISQPIRLLKSGAIMVAQLTEIIPAGPKPLAEVKQQIIQDLVLRKRSRHATCPCKRGESAQFAGQDPMAISTAPANTLANPALAPVTALMGPAESVNEVFAPASEICY